MSNTIRQLEEKLVAVEIVLLRWSDCMDLLALANARGEVSLHRLTWQRVWCLPPDKEGSLVTDMAWRPDGKILVIGYRSNCVVLVEVENKNILHTIEIESDISTLSWHLSKHNVSSNSENDTDFCSLSDSSKFLSDLPSLSGEYASPPKSPTENLVDLNFVKKQHDLNILIIGTSSGNLYITVFGIFTCVVQSMTEYIGKDCKILRTQFSNNLDTFYVTVRDIDDILQVLIIDTPFLHTHSKELFTMAIKYGHILSLIAYLDCTMSSITEAWESILLEMDSKLSKYAANVPEGTVSADFLDLLMFGIPSDEMEEFLMQDLTDKGLKKLGHSIELSYSNIQKLLLKHLTKVGQNLTYHLSELRGMARFAHRFKGLGLTEKSITSAIMANGAFLVKSVEVQQVINHSMTNYKAFFRWLYVVILRLMDEQIPPEIPKMAQQDLAYITEFLQNFDKIGTSQDGTKSGFNLERLGQYLIEGPLKIIPSNENNIWTKFLEENECLVEHESIIKHHEMMSLVDQHKHLLKSINSLFEGPKNEMSKILSNNCKNAVKCVKLNETINSTTFFNFNENITCMAFTHNSFLIEGCFYLEFNKEEELNVKGGFFYVNIPGQTELCKIIDVKFYSFLYLSILVESVDNTTYIYQVPMSHIRDNLSLVESKDDFGLTSVPRLNICDLTGLITKTVEGMTASQFAVSGSRHVSVVLSENQRKVQLFEMEADEEEEEEETDMTGNTTKNNSEIREMIHESITAITSDPFD